jgi:hypothetical protein
MAVATVIGARCGAWVGGVVAGAGGAVVCLPTGPGELVCVPAATAAGATVGGGLGAVAGAAAGESFCPDEDDCSEITQTIDALVDELEMRYEHLLMDLRGLYGNPPHPKYGSWEGHIHKYHRVQDDLRFQIALAKSKGCTVSPEAEEIVNRPPPVAPFSG